MTKETNTPTLETERLVLRRFTERDIPALFAIYSDPEVNRFLPWFPQKDEAEARKLFEEQFETAYQAPRGYRYAICLKNDGVPIGYVNVDTNDSHDLGYGLSRAFWHRGIVTEACKRVVRQVKEDAMPYITATHDVNNPHSGGVMKKLGMQYRYSYEEQWQPKDILVTFRMYQLNLDGNDGRTYMKYWDTYERHFVESL